MLEFNFFKRNNLKLHNFISRQQSDNSRYPLTVYMTGSPEIPHSSALRTQIIGYFDKIILLKQNRWPIKNNMIDEQTFFLPLSFCFEYFYFHNLSLFTFIVRNSYILCVFTAVYRNDDALKRPVGDEMNHLMRHGSKLNIFNH